jgi:hypothetical protein
MRTPPSAEKPAIDLAGSGGEGQGGSLSQSLWLQQLIQQQKCNII